MSFTLKMKKGDTGLIPISLAYKSLYKEFINNLEKDVVVEVTLIPITSEGTRPQVNKLHAIIREISNYTGHDFDDVKLYIKEKAGFITVSSEGNEVKSFGNMNKEELSACIQAAVNLADSLGINV
jgi:hypothetical protein